MATKYENARAALEAAREQVRIEEEKVRAAAREEMEKRRAVTDHRVRELRAKLEEEHGTKGHPKANLLWNKAWDHGHACGYSAVVSMYADLVELIL